MNQKTSSESIRFAPTALAIVLLATLGFLALHVQAEELDVENAVVQTRTQNGVQIRQNYVDQGEMKQDQKSEFAQNRQESLNKFRTYLNNKKSSLEERVQKHKEEREIKKNEYKARLSLSAQVRIGQYVDRIVSRMDTALVRFEQIGARITTRIEKLEEKGADLSDAKVELSNTYILIQDAHALVTLVEDVSSETLLSENPSEQVVEMREAVSLAKESLVSIHSALSETVKLIKAGIENRVVEENNDEEVTE